MVEHVITSVLHSKSEDAMRRSREVANNRIQPDELIHKTFRRFSGGAEKIEHEFYRIGDYFDRIEVACDPQVDPLSITLVFHVRKDADPYWRDIVVAVLRSISEETGASIRSVSPSS